MRVNVPLIGPTYTNRSVQVGNQHTQNFYIEANPQGEAAALMPFPGLKLFATAGSGESRGLGTYNGELYSISGTQLYKVNEDKTVNLKGVIGGSDRVKMIDDGQKLVIATGTTKPYAFDRVNVSLATDSDIPSAKTVAHINNRVVYERGDGVVFADLDSPLTANSANILLANTRADSVNAVITHKQQVFTFGDSTIEPSYFTGVGTPPYSRVNNSVQEIGTSSPYSIATSKDSIFFLGTDKSVYRMQGFTSQHIDNPAIAQEIQKYSTISDAKGIYILIDGQGWYILSFPTANRTWLFNESSGLWTSLSFGTADSQHLIHDYAYVYGRHLVSDRRNGNIYELDFDTFTDNGDVIQRQRVTQNINSRMLGGEPGKMLYMNRLELEFETGVSEVTSEATIIMQYSDDDGRSWSQERWATIGIQGDYTKRVQWFGFDRFYKRKFRFTMTDPVKWVFIRLIADVEVGLE